MAIPFLRKLPVQALQERQERVLRRLGIFAIVHLHALPLESISVLRESETIEEVFATDKRHVPQARRPIGVFLDRNLDFEVLKHLGAFAITFFRQIIFQTRERWKFYWRTDEQHGLPLHSAKDDLVRRPNAVDVGRDVRDDEVACIDHAEVHVQRGPEMVSAAGPGIRTLLRGVKTPLGSNLGGRCILSSILLDALYLRLEPGIKHRDSQLLKEFADAIAPAELFLNLSRRDEIHRS